VFNSHWLRTTPLLVSVKFGLGGRIRPPLKGQKNPNLSLNRSKLMSDIIQTHLQKLVVMVCGLTTSPVLLLCLITFKQSFNESVLFSL